MSISLLPQYWYVIAESSEVTSAKVLAREILGEWLACYRDAGGQIVVAQDRCIHRCARLSRGDMQDGKLSCRYHGWVYGQGGQVISIPAEGGAEPATAKKIKAKTYQVAEQDGYVYVCLHQGPLTPSRPLSLPELRPSLPGVVRLQNVFENSLANCVENYIDVPHTAYVHHGIFRKPKGEPLVTDVSRHEGALHIIYRGERLNLGSFSYFLNPSGREIEHSDHFYAPNTTSVHYRLPCGYQYEITSQSIPINDMKTLVYTDITYDFGIWTAAARWMVKRQAQRVIQQDIEILNEQGRSIEKYGQRFYRTEPDRIHDLTSEIIDGLYNGIPPAEIAPVQQEVVFHV